MRRMIVQTGMDPADYEEIKRIADEQDRSISQIARALLLSGLRTARAESGKPANSEAEE
jgi:hypothetical protein